MLLSEGQMSDYKGAADVMPALPGAKELLGDKGYDADWFREALAAPGHHRLHPLESQSQMPIKHDEAFSTANATRSRSCSAASRIGAASIPAMIDVHTPSCQPSVSPLSSSFGCDQ